MNVELCLIRHAAALDAGEGQADAERRLSPRGRKRFGRAVRGMERLGLRFERLLHSPLSRAVETAELCAPLLQGESIVCEGLARPPNEALLGELQLREDERIALVGHEPWISQLCSILLLGSKEHARALSFKKGGVVLLRGEPRPAGMVLHAFLPPRALRR